MYVILPLMVLYAFIIAADYMPVDGSGYGNGSGNGYGNGYGYGDGSGYGTRQPERNGVKRA